MEQGILNIYPILLLVLTFFGARLSKKGELASDFPTLSQTKLIQGFACLCVILHHITQQVTRYGVYNKGPITLFNYTGILSTALFFFFSGYGLITSVYHKENYLDTFLTKRFPTVLVPFWVINFLGVLLVTLVYGVRYSLVDVVKDLFGITLINSNGWFIIEIAVFYLFFFVFFKLIRNRDAALFLLCIAVICVIVYSYFQGHDAEGDKSHWFKGEWWFNSTITFIFGMLFARFRERITSFCSRHYRAFICVITLLFVLTLYASIYTVNRYGYYEQHLTGIGKYGKLITLFSQMAVCLVYVMLVLLLNMRITIGNRALKYISGVSVELFLIHGYFVSRIFGNVRMSDALRYAVVIACSIGCAALVSPAVRLLVKKTVEVLNRKRSFTLPRMRANVFFVVISGFLIALLVRLLSYAYAGKQYADECDAVLNARVGDEVLWGHFETDRKPGRERLTWIVLKRSGDNVCLVTKEGIGGCWYNQMHEAVSWEDSDLRALLNSKEYLGMFSRHELKSVVPTKGDVITLLTAEEARALFPSDADRELAITEKARLQGTNTNLLSKVNEWDMKGYRSSWWWLRGENAGRYAPIVTVDGLISEKEVNRTGGAIRPAIWVNCRQSD